MPMPPCPAEPRSRASLTPCCQAERIDYLEKSQGWKEEKFDLVLQYLRTVLLKRA